MGLPGRQIAQLAQAQQALAAEPTGVEADLSLWRQHLGIAAADGAVQEAATSFTYSFVHFYAHIPAGGGAVEILSTVPMIDWVLLGSGKSHKGQDLGSLHLRLVWRTHLASFGREMRVIIIVIRTSRQTKSQSVCVIHESMNKCWFR